MIAKELQDWFPEAQILDQPVEKEGYITLPLSSQQWILLDEAGLSEREKQLVALLTQQEKASSLNPWYPYLIEGKGQAPQTFKKIQLVYCHLSYFPTGKSILLARHDADFFFPTARQYCRSGLRIMYLCFNKISTPLFAQSYLIRLKRLSMTLTFVCLSCWGRCGFRQALKPYQT